MRRFAIWVMVWLLWPAAAQAVWLRADSPNFIVYGRKSEKDLRAKTVALEAFDSLLRTLIGVEEPPSPNRLTVYLVQGIGELRIVEPGAYMDVAGFYSASPSALAIFVDESARTNGRGDQGFEVLFHEYAHHFMMQYFPRAYPAWYVEGFAEFMSGTRIKDEVIEYGSVNNARSLWLTRSGEWEPMEQLLFEAEEMNPAGFYAQSWITVHYLFSDPARQAMLVEYLTAYGRGDEPRKAFEAAFRMSPAQLGADIRQYASNGEGIPVNRIGRAGIAAAPQIAVRRLPASAGDLLLLEAAIMKGAPEAGRLPYLANIRHIAARYRSDSYARRVLARAEILHGDAAAAEPILDDLLAEAPGDADLLYLRGMRHLMSGHRPEDRTAEARKAQPWFAKAHRADPNHFPTLFAYASSLAGEPNFVSENTANILLLAHQLAPQVRELRMHAALMQMQLGEFSNAEALLTPLLVDLHDAEAAEAARRWIADAKRGHPPEEALAAAAGSAQKAE